MQLLFLIANIQQKTENTVNAANSANAIIKEQMKAVSETDDAFKTILNSVISVTTGLDTMVWAILLMI